MKKKIIIIVIAILVVGGVALYLFLPGPPETTVSYYVPGEFFVTNIKDSTRLLKTTIVMELSKENQEEYLTEHNHIIRDIIVFTLREKTEDELRALDADDALRSEIVKRLRDRMKLDYIETIYFNDYVIQ